MEVLKSSGEFRIIDDLGRFVLPKTLRTRLNIQEGDLLAEQIEDDAVVLELFDSQKHEEYIIHRMDEIGRVALSKELTYSLGWKRLDYLEVFYRENQIVLKKTHKTMMRTERNKILTDDLLAIKEEFEDYSSEARRIQVEFLHKHDSEYQSVLKKIRQIYNNNEHISFLYEAQQGAVGHTITEKDIQDMSAVMSAIYKTKDIENSRIFFAGIVRGIKMVNSSQYVKLEKTLRSDKPE